MLVNWGKWELESRWRGGMLVWVRERQLRCAWAVMKCMPDGEVGNRGRGLLHIAHEEVLSHLNPKP